VDNASALRFLRYATVAIAALGIGCAFALLRVKSAFDAYWAMQSVFSGGMLGLFLLGYFSKKARNPEAVFGVVLGLLVIAWISIFQSRVSLPVALHTNLAIVLGTTTIFVVGFILAAVLRRK
jgi:SSS family solute:Na+ symporter